MPPPRQWRLGRRRRTGCMREARHRTSCRRRCTERRDRAHAQREARAAAKKQTFSRERASGLVIVSGRAAVLIQAFAGQRAPRAGVGGPVLTGRRHDAVVSPGYWPTASCTRARANARAAGREPRRRTGRSVRREVQSGVGGLPVDDAPIGRRRALLVESQQARVEREAHELGARVAVELLVDVRAMRLDRAQARTDELRDLGIRVPEREQSQHIGFLRRQPVDGRTRGVFGRPRCERDADRRLQIETAARDRADAGEEIVLVRRLQARIRRRRPRAPAARS